jgi:hypothetical protein
MPSKDVDDARGNNTRAGSQPLIWAASERLSTYHLAIINKELRRTLIRSANHRQQSSQLFARDQAQSPAFRAGEHGPIRIVFFSDAAGILQHKNGAGKHLFRDPLA